MCIGVYYIKLYVVYLNLNYIMISIEYTIIHIKISSANTANRKELDSSLKRKEQDRLPLGNCKAPLVRATEN